NGMRFRDDAGNVIPDAGWVGGPDFSGMGTFIVDQTYLSGLFLGNLTTNAFYSTPPITTKRPVSVTLKLAFFNWFGIEVIQLPINGAHIEFRTAVSNGRLTLTDGRLQGSIKKNDIDNIFVPAFADILTNRLRGDPETRYTAELRAIFDTGGCGMAKADDL